MQNQYTLIEFSLGEVQEIKVHCLPRTKNSSYTVYQLNAMCFVSPERSQVYCFGYR